MIKQLELMIRKYRSAYGRNPEEIHCGTLINKYIRDTGTRMHGGLVEHFGPIVTSFNRIPVKIIKDPKMKDRIYLLPAPTGSHPNGYP